MASLAVVAACASHEPVRGNEAQPPRAVAVDACRASNGVIDPTAFGADGGDSRDDAPAVQRALDCALEWANGTTARGAVLEFPPGTFRFDSAVRFDARGKGQAGLAIVGRGAQVTVLASHNAEGIFLLSFDHRRATVAVSDMTLLAGRSGAGTAIRMRQPPGGNQHRRSLVVRDVEITVAAGTKDYFEYGVHGVGLWRPLLDNVLMTGPYGPRAPTEHGTKTCFLLEEAYSPTVQQSRCWSAQVGLAIVSSRTPGPEGTTVSQCKFVQTDYGIRVSSYEGREPEVYIVNSHINSRVVGIHIERRKHVFLLNNLMYAAKQAQSYTDMLIDDSSTVMISGNIFHQTHPSQRVSLHLKDSSACVVSDNIFQTQGTGVQISGASEGNRVVDNSFADMDRAFSGPAASALLRHLPLGLPPDKPSMATRARLRAKRQAGRPAQAPTSEAPGP